MRYLVDTNIWLERLLGQERSDDVKSLLDKIPASNLYISDFSLHSIGLILNRFKKGKDFSKFINDLFVYNQVKLITLSPIELKEIVEVINLYKLDFDDSYQFLSAKKYSLEIISFDSDFLKTPIGKKDPMEIIDL